MRDVTVVGSTNLDVVATAARIPGPGETVMGSRLDEFAGGKGLNQAVASARAGANTSFVSCVGNDAAGESLRALMTSEGIETGRVAVVDEPTGRALITVGSNSENAIVVVAGANARVALDELGPTRVVLVQLEIPMSTVLDCFALAREAGATTVLNPAPAAVLSDELLDRCDYLIPNEHELDLIGGAQRPLDRGCRAVIVTLGSRGAEIVTTQGSRTVSPFDVSPVDTTGAGDAFCGTFAARIAAGDDVDAASTWACAAGALATTVRGAVPGQPTRDAIASLMRAQRRAPT